MYEIVTAIAATTTVLGSGVVGYFRMQTRIRQEIARVDEKLDQALLGLEHRLTMLEARSRG